MATYYLPEVYASYLDPFAPLILHQEHFAACGNKLYMNATDVVYYDFAVRKAGSSNWIPIPDWQLNYSFDGECAPESSDLRHGLGTSVRNGKKVLRSRSGHDNDVGLKRCDKPGGANLFTCSPPVLFSGIDSPPAGELAIRNVSVSSSSSGATLRWDTSRPASGLIRYGATSDLGSSSAASLALATTHSSAISGLPGACAINQRFWVFISGLTNQGWTVYIRDTVTGAAQTYSNPVGHLTTTTADTTSGLSCS